ncbi:TlpA disulfide reductase family protein [Thiomicrorhabdus xiamenensis]|uniref:TlpA family protein disulfide reductase n=1 Tax=Thiomicrorhabdus xiamenensis TaxID=2739063 RepID=A0A7D4NYY7_9GAMM|nr:TlpA disulfide reductase family protein [Thiomicrorhabdus xiamenensis]QKI89458.1 TlpA family protein disulfide reductase [Thiomicrorhabdus xiamenensis]
MKYLQNRLSKQLLTVFLASAVFIGFSTSVQAEESKEITFIDLDGNKSKLSDYRGKWVVVNLWATWCPPCLKEIPDLVMFHEAHAEKDAVVIGVNYEDIDPQKVKNFAESQMVNYPIVRFEGKPDGKTSPFGNLRGLPTTYMVTPEGQIVAARTGMVDGAMLEDFIKNFSQSR